MGGKTSTYDSELAGLRSPPFQKSFYIKLKDGALFSGSSTPCFFPSIRFASVLGQREDVPVKPHPQIVFDILSEAGVTASETLYVGDTGIDMQTARNAGVESIGVLWGFRTERELIENGAVHIISKPSEILNFISK